MSTTRWNCALLRSFAIVSLCLMLAACGSAGPATRVLPEQPEAGRQSFALNVLPESFAADAAERGSAEEIFLVERRHAQGRSIEIRARGARALKALYYTLSYDAALYTPLSAQASSEFAPTDELLALCLPEAAGKLQAGQVMLRPQEQDGFFGDGLLAVVQFADRPFSAAARSSSVAPTSNASRSTLELGEDGVSLEWLYFNAGEYSQNGEVNIGDLTPIGQNFNESADPEDFFAIETAESVVDGDGNGLINITDLTPIGANFLNRTLSYNVYSSNDIADYPADNAAPSTIEPDGFVNLTEATGDPAVVRLAFRFDIPLIKTGWFYWVRPCDAPDGAGSEGTPSTLVSIGGNGENEPPSAALLATPDSGEAPLSVTLDASGSTDSDGTVVQYSFDFEGDGSFEQVGSEPTAQHVYESGGTFNPQVLVLDDGAELDTATAQVTVSTADNVAPVADLTATPDSGEAPLSVTLNAADSTDVNGDSLTFEWDFDGDGSFDASTGSASAVVNSYSTPGFFQPKVRVTDSQGLSSTAGATVDVGESTNQPPVVSLSTQDDSGEAPFTLILDIAFSDPEGDTDLEAAIDLDGDSFPETEIEAPGQMEIQFDEAGLFTLRAEVTDSLGAVGSDELQVFVSDGGNVPPTVELSADPVEGNVPIEVVFTADFTDSDGTIGSFQWDFEDDGTFDLNTGNVATAEHTYTDAGQHRCRVLATDNEGATASVNVGMFFADPGNEPPVASFTVTPDSGSYPLTVSLDASGSTDIDGTVNSYEWDTNGDGSFDIRSDEGVVSFEHVMTFKGTTTIGLRVIDNDGIRSELATRTVTLDSGWFSIPVDDDVFSNKAPSLAVLQAGLVPSIVRLGIAYNDSISDQLRFVDSAINDPAVWTEPVVVAGGQNNAGLSLALVGNRPAVAFQNVNGNGGLAYARAVDTGGDNWTVPVSVHSLGSGQAFSPSLLMVSGQPAIACGGSQMRYYRALDDAGASWGPAVELGGGVIADGSVLRFIDGGPAIAWFNRQSQFVNGRLFYIAANDSTGSSWGSAVDTGVDARHDSVASLFPLSGIPAVGFSSGDVNFVAAADVAGSSWNAPLNTFPGDNNEASHTRLAVLDGLPCLFFCVVNRNNLMLQRASAADGSAWLPPEPVAVGSGPASFIVFKGQPVIASYQAVPNDNSALHVLLLDEGGA